MLDMLSGSSEEGIPIEALVELEIQVVLEVLVVVGDYEALKQFPQHSNSYEDDPTLVVMVVVDPFYKEEYIDVKVRYYNHQNTTYIYWT